MFLGRDYADKQNYSAETSKRIDDEVERILRKAHEKARNMLDARRRQMDTMAQVLLARETVEGDAVQALLDDKWDEYCAGQAAAEQSPAAVATTASADPSQQEQAQ